MIKEERMYTTVITLQDGVKNSVRYFEDGSVIQTFNNGNVRYDASNRINSYFLNNEKDINEETEDILDFNDFYSALCKYNLGSIISSTLIIKSEMQKQRITIDENISMYNTLYTTAELLLIFGDQSSPITVKRNVFIKGTPNKSNILNAIERELSKLNDQFSSVISSKIITVDPNEYEIILPSGIGGIFIHEAIGHCLEGDLFFEKNNVLRKNLGKRITSNNITISDRCTPDDMVSFCISDDGIVPEEAILINGGILEGVMTDTNISKKYNIKNTGNGRAASCHNFPLPRMRNTYLHNGDESPESIIKSTHKGIIATDMVSGSVMTENGEFVFNVNNGLILENGEIVGITKPFLFTSNVTDALEKINAIGNDLAFYPSRCGKNGQLINISYGQPTIRIEKNGGHL
ncbi:TldD/PmbA family protein [Ruminococcus sp.]|uniref:TldD/PmbA family protein n=1 Tax=Ruminococcus sp. TaxID=41978 RepID=UPI001B25E627|nr:TldD/PmbA family protein [Ruminococcus sp.]MBO5559072.1 TldD/PmbA family protein [Ruminococcus sp.]